MTTLPPARPILSCAEAGKLEAQLLCGDQSLEWAAMLRAGTGLAHAALRDFKEIGCFPVDARVLVLCGKGNNGGDALIAAGEVLRIHPQARVDVVFPYGERTLRPLARKAWQQLAGAEPSRVATIGAPGLPRLCRQDRSARLNPLNADLSRGSLCIADATAETGGRVYGRSAYDLCLDGVFGFQFRPPLDAVAGRLFRWANELPIRMRAAVDLPSGLNEDGAFRADFTYATGSLKAPLLDCANAGRLRYVDIGFFESEKGVSVAGAKATAAAEDFVLTHEVLKPLAGLRPAAGDKRTYGHLFLFGGSRDFPGAILMATMAALRSGAGLVTACVPASLAASFAAHAPEAMWHAWPETADGSLAPMPRGYLRDRLKRATALVVGPGIGTNPRTHELIASLTRLSSTLPVLLDADALQPDIVRGAKAPLILTPHAGEFARVAGKANLRAYCQKTGATVVLKGPVTRICGAQGTGARAKRQGVPVFHSLFGGPVLARGGSGDILSGLTGGLLAQHPKEILLASCRAVAWHGSAADLLARSQGQTSAVVTQVLDHLPEALREVTTM